MHICFKIEEQNKRGEMIDDKIFEKLHRYAEFLLFPFSKPFENVDLECAQARIRVKNRKRKADEPSCPVCSERLSGTPEELNQHVERCLNKHNNGNPAGQNNLDEEEVDVEGDAETFEEYEWAGQRRVRASSMLVGGFSGKFIQRQIKYIFRPRHITYLLDP